MCGRFTLSLAADRAARELGIPVETWLEMVTRPRFNIAPMQTHPVVVMPREDRELAPARWGLVNFWAKDNKRAARQINARAETLDTRPAYRAAFKSRRCVVPADGFYEWTGPKAKRQPLWYHRPDGGLLLFAGLYESWRAEPEREETTFTIVTTRANELMAPVHDRMPVVLADCAVDEWLFAEATDVTALKDLLAPPPDDLLTVTPASMRVNAVKNDDAALLVAEEATL